MILAPISIRVLKSPVRSGLMPISRMFNFESGVIKQATAANAAEDGSPGISIDCAVNSG